MFKLIRLSLFGLQDNQEFSYRFSDGINYFRGKNDSGKTEFYFFLDYMFGANFDLSSKEWFRDSLDHAELTFSVDGRRFAITRYLSNPNKNFLRYIDEEYAEPIRLGEYREKLNLIFSRGETALKELRTFVEENVGYRTFTVFNFLGENRQGVLNDFFDKCSLIEYCIRMPSLLNYIFNKNIARIDELKKQEENLKQSLEKLEKQALQNDDIRSRINYQLKILGIHRVFNGENGDTILHEIFLLQNSLQKTAMPEKSLTITELEAIYTSLDEQIKKQSTFEHDHKKFVEDDIKQKVLLEKLQEIIAKRTEYNYLVAPIIKVVNDLERSISFNKYLIQENTTKELKKQQEKVREEILSSQTKYTIYSSSDKAQAITLIKEYLNYYNVDFDGEKLLSVRRDLRRLREEIRALQNANDKDKLDHLSADITHLYKASEHVSDLSKLDFDKEGFHIDYIKNGNSLQPQILDDSSIAQYSNYYTGSMARHTLMQLCGYLGFLRMLIRDNKYPLIPFLVVDHISKPFDEKNSRGIGAVIHEAYSDIDKSQLQIILFDDEDATNLGIVPDYNADLVFEGKSGFNPFYYAIPKET